MGLNVDERVWAWLERLIESRDSEERADGWRCGVERSTKSQHGRHAAERLLKAALHDSSSRAISSLPNV